MCGRYRLKDPKAAFDWVEVAPSFDFRPRFNIAPTQKVPVVTAFHHVELMEWGIVPAWAAEKSKALINARSESVREKRSFKSSFTQRRCLVPADGFYEWTKIDKRPHFFSVNDGAPFAIAGIWEKGQDGSRCCLLTTSANSVLSPIHNRMPVIVRREDWEEWMEPGELADQSFQRITTPYASEEMSVIEVSPLVNSGRVDDPRCSEPLQYPQKNGKTPMNEAAYNPEEESDGLTFNELRKLSADALEAIGMTPAQRDIIVGDDLDADVNSHDE